jgi:SRSO17 transposase
MALGLLDTLAEWRSRAPVVVADAGYGVSTLFRVGLQERGLSYVLALTGKQVAHPEDGGPHARVHPGRERARPPRHRGSGDVEVRCPGTASAVGVSVTALTDRRETGISGAAETRHADRRSRGSVPAGRAGRRAASSARPPLLS